MASRAQPRPIRPRAGDAVKYEQAIRRAYTDPMMRRIQRRFAKAAALDQAYRALDGEVSAIMAQPRQGIPLSAIQESLSRVNTYNRQRLRQTFQSALGVDVNPLLLDTPTEIYMQQRISDNVDLIKTIPPRMHDSLKDRIEKLTRTAAFDQNILMKALRDEYKSTGYNVRRITRDQTQKLTKQLAQVRYEQLGIQGYRWQTVGDGDVRPTHQDNNAKIFRWDDPPAATGNPGRDIQCRCVAIPVVTRADRERLQRNAPAASRPTAASGPAGKASRPAPRSPAPKQRPVATAPLVPPVVPREAKKWPKPKPGDPVPTEAVDAVRQMKAAGAPSGFGDTELMDVARRFRGSQAIRVVDGTEFDRIRRKPLVRGIGERKYIDGNLDGTAGGEGIYGRAQYYSNFQGEATEALYFAKVNFKYVETGVVYATKWTDGAVVLTHKAWTALVKNKLRKGGSHGLPDDVVDWVNVDHKARIPLVYGVDAYEVPGHKGGKYTIVLNRAKLVADKRSMPDGEFYKLTAADEARMAADKARLEELDNQQLGMFGKEYFEQLSLTRRVEENYMPYAIEKMETAYGAV